MGDIVLRVEEVLERITRPLSSPIAAEILKITQDERSSARDLDEVITRDKTFTERMLRLVNATHGGSRKRITTVSRSISVLGFDTIKALALVLYVFGYSRPDEGGMVTMRQLWEHSLGCAVGARRIAAHGGRGAPEEAFVAGLFHDIGRALLYHYFREEFVASAARVEQMGETLCEAERELLGTNHPAVGEVWTRRWNLSPVIHQSVRFHHDPLSIPHAVESSVREIVAVVHVADIFCEACQIGKEGDRVAIPSDKALDSLVSMGAETCRLLFTPVRQEVNETTAMLDMAAKESVAGRNGQTRTGPRTDPRSSPLTPSGQPSSTDKADKMGGLDQPAPALPELSLDQALGPKIQGKVIKFPEYVKHKRAPRRSLNGKPTILVVEDHGSLRDLIGFYLRSHGYEVETVGDGSAALEFLAVEDVDLVILDLMLPRTDGFEVLKRLSEGKEKTGESLPYIIVVSARDAEQDRKKVLKMGGNEYLPKPFNMSSLLKRVQAVEEGLA